jgi:hypothetical protein
MERNLAIVILCGDTWIRGKISDLRKGAIYYLDVPSGQHYLRRATSDAEQVDGCWMVHWDDPHEHSWPDLRVPVVS